MKTEYSSARDVQVFLELLRKELKKKEEEFIICKIANITIILYILPKLYMRNLEIEKQKTGEKIYYIYPGVSGIR